MSRLPRSRALWHDATPTRGWSFLDLRWLFALVPVLALAVAAAAWFHLATVTTAAIERAGFRALGVPVEAGTVRPTHDPPGLEVRDVLVANPDRFGPGPLASIGRIHIQFASLPRPGALPVLGEIRLEDVTLEVRLRRHDRLNVVELVEQVDSFRRRGLERERADPGAPRLQIGRVSLSGLRVRADLGPAWGLRGQFEQKLRDIRLVPIEGEGAIVLHSELAAELGGGLVALLATVGEGVFPEPVEVRLHELGDRELGRERRLLTGERNQRW